jgi:uncharacterized protein (DUF58 family)
LLRTYVRGGPSAGLVARLVEAMALLQPVLVEPDPGVLVTTVLTRVRQRALLVLFTDLNSAALEEGLLPVLGALTARHTVVIAAVGDPAIDAMAGLRGAATGVYAAAAAEKSRTQRRRMATELRRRGVETVEAPAGRFAPAVADAYLSLKAAGRL